MTLVLNCYHYVSLARSDIYLSITSLASKIMNAPHINSFIHDENTARLELAFYIVHYIMQYILL